MSSKQTVWKCTSCGAEHTAAPSYPMDLITCRKCGGPVKAIVAYPSPVHGLGMRGGLDLGLALLMDAQQPTGVKFRKEKDFRDRPGK